jgi:hypothetical protein
MGSQEPNRMAKGKIKMNLNLFVFIMSVFK